jgi:hypothetical protein
MDSGEAAIWGAAIGSAGTLVASVIVPIVSGTVGAKRRTEAARRAALRERFPPVIRAVSEPPSPVNLETIAMFTMLLKRDEWQIDEMVVATLARANTPDGSKIAGHLVAAVTAWMRGELDPRAAASYFKKETGLDIKPTDFKTT